VSGLKVVISSTFGSVMKGSHSGGQVVMSSGSKAGIALSCARRGLSRRHAEKAEVCDFVPGIFWRILAPKSAKWIRAYGRLRA
jgi:hypothetical protein